MTKLKTLLSSLLALQLLLAGGLLAFNYQRGEGSKAEPLFDKASVKIGRMEISDDENTITLAKVNDNWVLPEQDNLPVTESKVTSTLDSLADIRFVWPVSTSGSSHERFEVASDNFQREVKLFDGDTLVAHFYVGTSPGFRKVHVRRADDSEVYAVALNSFDFPTNVDEWLEKSLLNVVDASVIKGPDFTINKQGEAWQFETDTNEALALDTEKAQQLATAFSNFRVQDIAESTPEGETVVFNVSAGSDNWEFKFSRQGEEDQEKYFVQRSDMDKVFTLSKYDFERIANINRDALIVEMEETQVDDSDSTPEPETESAEQ